MRKHLLYLRYVLAHKAYVLRAGLAIATVVPEYLGWRKLAWVWRLLVHDLSKFSRAEWTPYAVYFYGDAPEIECPRCQRTPASWKLTAPPICGDCGHHLTSDEFDIENRRVATEKRERQAAFNYAWLHHQHVQPHHWQHHILHEDSGKTIVLTPPRVCVDEMVADWLAAGPKAMRVHSMAEAVEETIKWYAKAHAAQTMRTLAKNRAELLLVLLADRYGLTARANDLVAARNTRVSLTINPSEL